MAERSIEIVTGDGDSVDRKMTSVRLEANGGKFGNGRDTYSIYVSGMVGEAGASISKEAIFEALSEFFSVDITPRPEPIKPLEVGDVVEDVSVLTQVEDNRRAVLIDADGDVWAWDNENETWTVALLGYTASIIEEPLNYPMKVIAIRDTIEPLP